VNKKIAFKPINTPCLKIFNNLQNWFASHVLEELVKFPSLYNNRIAIYGTVSTDNHANTIVSSVAMEGIELEYIIAGL